MLPTKGYFQDIECPFNNTTCGRPYCHFRHKKKPNENLEENLQDSSKTVVPTYKPTPKSELANIHNNRSHIPISYVPDLAFKRERTARPITRIETPTYKPTPLSILSSANKLDTSLPENHEHKETIKELQENIASNVYDPLKSEINFEDLSNEFDLIDDIINDTEEPPPSTINDNLIKIENDIEKQQNKLNLLQSNLSTSDLGENERENTSKKDIKFKATSTKTKHTEKNSKSSVSQGVSSPVVIKKEKSDNDEKKVQIESKVSKDKAKKKEKERDSSKDKTKTSGEKNKDKGKSSSSKSRENKDSSKSKENSLKTTEKSSKTHKSSEREKHRKEEKKDSSKDDKKDLKDRHKSKNKSKDRSRSKSPSKKEQKRSKHRSESSSNSEHISKEKKKSKHRNESSSDSETYLSDSSIDIKPKLQKKSKNGKSTDRSHSKDKSEKVRKKSREKSTSRSRSRSLSKGKELKHKSRHRSGSSNGHKERDKKPSKSKEKDKEISSEKSQKGDKKDKERSKVSSSSKEKKSKNDSKKSHEDKKEKRKKSTSESNTSQFDNDNDNIPFDNDHMDTEDLIPSDIDLDLEDEDETMRQCYEIFNEYKPTPIQPEPKRETEYKDLFEEDNNLYQAKKRVAYASAANTTTYLKEPAPPKPKSLRPGQTLLNRYRIAQMAQGSNEQENIINEVRNMTQQPIKRPATSLLEAARQHKMKKLEQQRLREKEKQKTSLVDQILNGVHKPSASQSQVKAAPPKKIAAVPNVALIQKAKERISFIKQQRAQSAAKTTAQTQKTGRVAHVPQFTLADIPDVLEAEKSKLPVNVRTRFLTMIAEECTKLYALKQDAFTRALNEEFTCYEKCKVLATYRNSAMLAVNRLRKELQDREVKGLGRLLSGESAVSEKESDFKGKRFYEHVKKWILSDEDLDVHGYPRESAERGKAIINNREVVDYSIVDNNHRKCSRCHRIYQVDDDGWPLFEEECMYHPNKKRTIRGEQVFLCCKSSDDTGCVTSDTHVFDGLKEHLLEGFQTTMPPESDNDPRNIAVYALDCEMCYTTKGLELTRVTIVDIDSKTVYESFVKPMNPIIDYNTRFSGITKEQMDRTSTSILQIQANILHLCNSETILVGHSLESDLKALKIVHGTVIDTSVLFPHKMGLPHKRALRALASEYLRKIIQNDVSGHDSAEDAITCMELLRWKLKEELKVRTK